MQDRRPSCWDSSSSIEHFEEQLLHDLKARISIAKCYTPPEKHYPSDLTSQGRQPMRIGSMEVKMEAFTGPLMYLTIAWGVVTAVFLGLILWRSILTNHEDDQLFIDAAGDHAAKDQAQLIAQIGRLSAPIMTTGVLAGVLLLSIAGLWLYGGLKSF
jgi:hypothetical protein